MFVVYDLSTIGSTLVVNVYQYFDQRRGYLEYWRLRLQFPSTADLRTRLLNCASSSLDSLPPSISSELRSRISAVYPPSATVVHHLDDMTPTSTLESYSPQPSYKPRPTSAQPTPSLAALAGLSLPAPPVLPSPAPAPLQLAHVPSSPPISYSVSSTAAIVPSLGTSSLAFESLFSSLSADISTAILSFFWFLCFMWLLGLRDDQQRARQSRRLLSPHRPEHRFAPTVVSVPSGDMPILLEASAPAACPYSPEDGFFHTKFLVPLFFLIDRSNPVHLLGLFALDVALDAIFDSFPDLAQWSWSDVWRRSGRGSLGLTHTVKTLVHSFVDALSVRRVDAFDESMFGQFVAMLSSDGAFSAAKWKGIDSLFDGASGHLDHGEF